MTAAKLKKGILAVLKYFTLILGAFVSILPLVVCVITAFKSPEEYASTNVMTLPKSWTYVENFIQAWKQANMGVAFRNSFIILVFVLMTFSPILIETITEWIRRIYEKSLDREDENKGFFARFLERVQK